MSKRLHLQQASMQWRDNDRQTRQDLERVLGRGAHLIGFTEVSKKNGNLALLRAVAAETGHSVVYEAEQAGGETAIAVAPGIEVLGKGAELVNRAESGEPPAGGHSVRYATWARVRWEGESVFFVEAHWVTHWRQQASRLAKHEAMSRTVVELAQRHGRGTRLSFFAGDTNADEETDTGRNARGAHSVLTGGGLVTIWDELSTYPPTHGGKDGGTIDVVGSYDRDSRVSAARARVWPRGHSDHSPVSAWYDVAPKAVRPHDCPTCGLSHRPPA